MPCTEAGRKGGRASGIQAVKQVSSHGQQHWGPHIIAHQRQSTVHMGSNNVLSVMDDIDRSSNFGHTICKDPRERFLYHIFTPRTRRIVDRLTY